jgi:hypothetical protein
LICWTWPFVSTAIRSRTTVFPVCTALWIAVRRSSRNPLRAMLTTSALGAPTAGSRKRPVRGEK